MIDDNKSQLTASRRSVLKAMILLALATTSLSKFIVPGPANAAGKKVIIGAFADGGLTPFKQKIIPLAMEAGFDIEFLEDEYGVTLEKWFADAQNSAGQYDIYLLDDPWVPQFGAANVLEDLGAAGLSADDKDWIDPMLEMGFWPPRSGARAAAFKDATPTLICVPFIGDLQTMTYRNDVYTNGAPTTWDEVIAKGKEGVAAGKIKYPVVFRGVAGNSIVTSWYPIFLSFGGEFFDDNWNPTFNSDAGKAAADFFVGTMKQNAPAGVVEFDSDQEGAAILGGDAGAIIQYSGNALKADDPAQSKVAGKLDFGVTPKQVKAISQMGIFIAGVPKSAPNRANAIEFLKWYTSAETQAKVAESGMIPVKRSAFGVAKPGNRLIPVALKQLDVGAQPRPRMPEWAKVEELLGIELNKALQTGSGGAAAMDAAAKQVREYLTQAGYYQ
ncbi:MAG: extracellular solute-binding protein [Phyllobacterium sp.]|uniref:extracellular solute-binding protein n=1 Tax=Phyllobacterium sp. TaxID=1871046 RepID=UPI0030F2581D